MKMFDRVRRIIILLRRIPRGKLRGAQMRFIPLEIIPPPRSAGRGLPHGNNPRGDLNTSRGFLTGFISVSRIGLWRNRAFHPTLFLGIIAVALITVMNVIIFALSFPGLAAAPAMMSAGQSLSSSSRVYRPFSPPDFLADLEIRSVDLSLINSAPRALLRYRAGDAVPLASLTKLMTAIVALEQEPDWSKKVIIIESDQRGGAKPKIFPREEVSLGDLWRLMLIGSDNDSVIALIRGLKIDEKDFVALMNQRALELGLSHTFFAEPTGLSPANVSTAREFAIIAREALFKEEIADELAMVSADVTVDGKPRRVYNSDQQLKSFRGSDGAWIFLTGKTGYLTEAGFSAALLSSNDAGQIISVVILGSQSSGARLQAVDRLLSWAFSELSEKSRQR